MPLQIVLFQGAVFTNELEVELRNLGKRQPAFGNI